RAGALAVEVEVADMKLPARAFELFLVSTVDGASQTKLRVVSNLQRVVIILRFDNCQHRTKYFFLFDRRARLYISNHGRLNEETLLAIRAAAAHNSPAFALALLDVRVNRLECFLVD